jgi:hypothetical protein
MTNEGNSRMILCDWCGQVTHLEWRDDGAGYCLACHRELLKMPVDDDG